MDFCASILLLFFLGFERLATAQDCSNKTLEFCLNFLSSDGLDIQHIDDDLPNWNESVSALQHRCSSFDKFTECMSGVTEKCSTRKYEGWIDAYEFLCQKSNTTLVANYLKCYESPVVVNSYDQICKSVFDFKSKELLNGSNTVTTDKMTDYCKLADGFFACINKTLTMNCGEAAATWQWNWDRTLSMPILRSCPGWSTDGTDGGSDSGTSAWTIALIIVLIFVTGFMILAIVFLLIFLLKKRKLRSRSQQIRRQTQSALPPPPYSAVIFTSTEPGAEPQAHLVDSGVALTAEQLGGVESPTAHGDVVLPPPYVGDRPPVPAYDSLPKNTREERKKEEEKKDEEIVAGQPEINADETNLDSDKNRSDA